jgi:hypothetical protein
MVIDARPLGVGLVLAIGLGFGPLLTEIVLGIGGSASAAPIAPIGTVPVPSPDLAKMMPAAPVQTMLAQADDPAPPPSPDAIVTTPPPAPLAETPPPPPFPGYVWDPGHWTWDGSQYVWEPGKYHRPAHHRCDVHSRVLAAILRWMGLGGRPLELGDPGRGRVG